MEGSSGKWQEAVGIDGAIPSVGDGEMVRRGQLGLQNREGRRGSPCPVAWLASCTLQLQKAWYSVENEDKTS